MLINICLRVVNPPVKKTSKNGSEFFQFSAIFNEYTNGSTISSWFNCIVFNHSYEKFLLKLKKGDFVEISGDMTVSPYLDKSTNEPKCSFNLVVAMIRYVSYGNFENKDNMQHEETAITEEVKKIKESASMAASASSTKNKHAEEIDDLPF